MKTLIFLLVTLQALSPTLNAPLTGTDVATELEIPDDRVHKHEDPVREGKWTFNYNPGYISVHSVIGDEFSIGHKANIEIGIIESKTNSVDPAPGLSVCSASKEKLTADCFCKAEIGGEQCSAGEICVDGQCLNDCDPGPYELQADCFCRNINIGVLCLKGRICENGECLTKGTDNALFPCVFDDGMLSPPNQEDDASSIHDTRPLFDWTSNGNIIPFYYSGNDVWTEDKNLVREVMDKIKDKTCFTFQDITTDSNKDKHKLEIKIKSDSVGCTRQAGVTEADYEIDKTLLLTFYGRLTKLDPQTATSTGEDCGVKGLILHELMHVLGMGHTQKRKDRNQYIKVNFADLNSESVKNQYRICEDCTLYENIPYDCDSIMHYGTDLGEHEIIKVLENVTSTCSLPEKHKWLSMEDPATAQDWELLTTICKGCRKDETITSECMCYGNSCAKGSVCASSGSTCIPGREARSVKETVVIRGKIILPAELDFTFPEDSRVHVSCDDISNVPSTNLGSVAVDVSNKSNEQEINYELEAEIQNSGSISMSATINVGWNRDQSGDEWIRQGDFFNEISYSLYVAEKTSEYEMDISVVLYDY